MNLLTKTTLENPAIAKAVKDVNIDHTIYSLNRIVRYHTSPTFKDIELGKEEIQRIAMREMRYSCRRIIYLNKEVYRLSGQFLFPMDEKGEKIYTIVENMTNEQCLEVIEQYLVVTREIVVSVNDLDFKTA